MRLFFVNSSGPAILLAILLLLIVFSGCSNNPPPDYDFFVAGHTYGRPGANTVGLHPPFMAAIKKHDLNRFDFGVLTGDVIWVPTPETWDDVDRDLGEFPYPVHIAIGNHDVTDRELYTNRYGKTWYAFRHHGDLCVILDGETEHGSLTQQQIAWLATELAKPGYRRVFLFVHKLIWVQEDTPWFALMPFLNSEIGYVFAGNFWQEVEPMLQTADVPVYLFAGDIGVTTSIALFWQQVGNVTLIASGMGGCKEENYLEVSVKADTVAVRAVRLDDEPLKLGNIEAYSLEYYRALGAGNGK